MDYYILNASTVARAAEVDRLICGGEVRIASQRGVHVRHSHLGDLWMWPQLILAALRAKVKIQNYMAPSGSGPKSAQNPRSPQGNDSPDPAAGPPGGGGAKNKIKNSFKHS